MEFVKLIPKFIEYPNIWSNYDSEADVLYIDFKKPAKIDDSELTSDNVVIRYEKDEVVGITILNAKKSKLVKG